MRKITVVALLLYAGLFIASAVSIHHKQYFNGFKTVENDNQKQENKFFESNDRYGGKMEKVTAQTKFGMKSLKNKVKKAGKRIGSGMTTSANKVGSAVEGKLSKAKCELCQRVISNSEGIIKDEGCAAANVSIGSLCISFGGSTNPLSDSCAIAFSEKCPEFSEMIAHKTFTIHGACKLMTMC